MKILQVFDMFSMPHGGGTVDVIYKLSHALHERGHEVTICTTDYQLDKDLAWELNVPFKVNHSILNLPGMYFCPEAVKIDVTKYDVIHFHCFRSILNAVLYEKAIQHRIPYVIDAHGSTVDLGKHSLKRIYDGLIGCRALKHAYKLIAETEVGENEYLRLGAYWPQIIMIHPLFDTREFDSLPERGLFRQKYEDYGKTVLFLGRIHWAKGLDTLVKAMPKDATLVIVGQDDGYKDEVVRLAEEHGVRVIFTGYLTGEDKKSALVDADVLIQPSMNEAGARPSIEAILCNTPVIVSRNTGAGRQIDRMNAGYLFDYGDVQQLRDTIQYVFDHPDETQEKTQKAKLLVRETLSLDKQIVKFEQLYKDSASKSVDKAH